MLRSLRPRRSLVAAVVLALAGCGAAAPEPEGAPATAPPAAPAPEGEPDRAPPEAPAPAPEARGDARPVPAAPSAAPSAATEPAPPAPPAPARDAPAQPPPVLAQVPPPRQQPPERPPERSPEERPGRQHDRPPAERGQARPVAEVAATGGLDLEALRGDQTFARELPSIPAPDDGAPEVIGPGAGGDDAAHFLRVGAARIGGEFDAAGDEEVEVRAEVAGHDVVLWAETLDLGDALGDFEPAHPRWLELPSADAWTIELHVVEVDETDEEHLAEAAPVTLRREAVGPTEGALELPLGTIRGVAVRIFGPNRTIELKGGHVRLAHVRAPRRAGHDAASRAAAAKLLAPLREVPCPRAAKEAEAACHRLADAGDALMRAAAGSTDGHLRAVLPPAAVEARQAAVLCGAAALGAPARYVEARRDVRAKAAAWAPPPAAGAPEAAARAAVDAFLALEPPGPGGDPAAADEALAALEAARARAIDALDAWLDAREGGYDFTAPPAVVRTALTQLEGPVEALGQGRRALAVLPAVWAALAAAADRALE